MTTVDLEPGSGFSYSQTDPPPVEADEPGEAGSERALGTVALIAAALLPYGLLMAVA